MVYIATDEKYASFVVQHWPMCRTAERPGSGAGAAAKFHHTVVSVGLGSGAILLAVG